MASEKESTKAAPKASLFDQQSKAAKPVTTFTEEWIGQSPQDLVPGQTVDDTMHYKVDEILGRECLITGYSLREGDKGEFAIIGLVLKEDPDTVASATCGGVAILRKLKAVSARGSFPVFGRFVKPEGKRYFDFID